MCRSTRASLARYLLVIIVVFSLAANPLWNWAQVSAQDLQDDLWSDPINLSRSGAANHPSMVLDSDGVLHVTWGDQYSGSVAAHLEGQDWSQPVTAGFPFSPYLPRLVGDNLGRVHAFWLDDGNNLWYSRVLNGQFETGRAWISPAILAISVANVAVTVDDQDRLHAVYLRVVDTPEFPAGVYYRGFTSGRDEWSPAEPLYLSAYLRGLTRETSSLSIAIGGSGEGVTLLATWDNRPRRQIFLARSLDGGVSWSEPQVIAAPAVGSEGNLPQNLVVSARAAEVFLTWQIHLSGAGCAQYYKWSADGGETWGATEKLEVFNGCLQSSNLLATKAAPAVLFVMAPTGASLIAWDGTRWSNPQRILDNFVDPETFSPVTLGCLQNTIDLAGRLIVIGCDLNVGGDIWHISRALGNIERWFPGPVDWSEPTAIAVNLSPISSLSLLVDSQERMHAFWSQTDRRATEERTVLYYMRGTADRWSRPVVVLASPEGNVYQPVITLSPDNFFMAVWNDDVSGSLFFSMVDIDRANLPPEWASARVLPAPRLPVESPEIVAATNGSIYVIYAIPLNEARGIYLTMSEDKGKAWTEPVRVFDGVKAGWDWVDHPHLTLTGNGELHVLFERHSTLAGRGAVELYYARSRDHGGTWSEPELVTGNPPTWDRIVAVGDQALQRMWQERLAGQPTIRYQVSGDNGQTWSRARSILSSGEPLSSPAVQKDRAGRLHVVQFFEGNSGQLLLKHWMWDGTAWVDDGLSVNSSQPVQVIGEALAISPAGRLGLLYGNRRTVQPGNLIVDDLYLIGRAIELPAELVGAPTIAPTPSEMPETVSLPAVVEGAESTPTLSLPVDRPVGVSLGGISLNDQWTGVFLGGILAALLVGSAFGILVIARLKARQR
jgi:hypothetical protein